MKYAIMASPENAALIKSNSVEIAAAGIEVHASPYCPTWGPRPVWWRRWLLRQKRQRVIYKVRMDSFVGWIS